MRYTLLGDSGLRVSELCLGTMTFGTDWGWGADQHESRAQFEVFANAGGTFIDTANKYTDGTAEKFVGEFVAGDRERFVVATKYSLNMRDGDLNAGGNHRKNLVQSLDASLRRLRSDYVDVLWLHAWDYLTPVDEVVRALDDQVRAGKVLYLGVSDTPAWVVAELQTIARLRGWSPFVGLQIPFSLVQREVERDLVPMARALGLGVTAWSPLGGGLLSGKYNRPPNGREARRLGEIEPDKLAIAEAVRHVAEQLGVSTAQAAIAWLRAQGGVIPILGARTAAQLQANLGALDVQLSADQLAHLDEVSRIPLGFPHDFLREDSFVFGTQRTRLDLPPSRREHGR